MNHIYKYYSVALVILFLSLAGCGSKTTEDPNKSYKLWAGEKPPKEIQVIHGKYWSSSHWSKEYIMYLEIIASSQWRKDFIEQNKLVQNKLDVNLPKEAPMWFKPGQNFKIWTLPASDQESMYFEDTTDGHMFIHEVQL